MKHIVYLYFIYSLNQGVGIHSGVPDVDDVNGVFWCVIVMDQFETTIHHLTSNMVFLEMPLYKGLRNILCFQTSNKHLTIS